MIKRVIVLNLPFREDRKWFMMGHLSTVGVPPSCIEFFPAKYGGDYATVASIKDAAVADGFPFLNRLADDGIDSKAKNEVAYRWNWCSMLTEIANKNGIVLVLLDDRYLKIKWDHLCGCVKFLLNNYASSDVLQLGWWLGVNEDIEPDIIEETMIARGVRTNGDYGTVLSPNGAKRLLKAIEDKPWVGTERTFYNWSRLKTGTEGLFHMVYPVCEVELYRWKSDMASTDIESKKIISSTAAPQA